MPETHDVIIIGAGPAGLSCAIEARRAGLSHLILEKGSLVDAIRRFPRNLTWFSTPELLEIGGIPFPTATVRPTRIEAIAYYQKVATHFSLNVSCFNAVESLSKSDSGFDVKSATGKVHQGKNVVVATGYFDHPNRLRVPGEDLPHVFHYYDEPFMFYGAKVVVVGGRNSAVEAALDLYRHGARVTMVHRGSTLSQGVKYWILPDIENRLGAGEIIGLFNSTVERIQPGSVTVRTGDQTRDESADFVFVLIGFHPDGSLLRKLGLDIDPETLGPVYDQKTFLTTVPGVYVAGSVVAGRFNNKVFVENGRLHGAVIINSILSGST